MTKKVTTSPEEKLGEAAEAVKLHKIHEEDFFKNLGNSTEFDKLCNEIDGKGIAKSTEAKQLCIDLVRRLEKLSKDNTSKYNDYCSYLRYWLYEKVGDIHTDKSVNVDDAPFFKHLIEAWKKMNSDKLKSKCAPGELKRVKLNELKNRIFSYIYFKNLEKIHNISASKKENDCTKYLTYLESFKPVHDRYNNAQCGSLLFWLSNKTDYFSCDHKHKLTSLMTELQKCKNGDKEKLKAVASGPDRSKVVAAAAPAGDQKVSGSATEPKASVVVTSKIGDKPDPKTVLPSQAVGKGDLGAAPAKDQKVSGGTTELKAPVAVTSSSSSSTAVTTSPAVSTTKVTTLSTPATTTSTVAAAKPVTITTQAKTTSAATTTNTVTTTSSSSQRSSWFLSGLFSSPRSQTSTSTSNTRASTKPVTTTGTSSVRSSAVTVTTYSPGAAGSISSTGQGVLTRPLATGVEHGKSLSPQLQGSPGYPLNSVSSNNLNIGGDSPPATITDVPGTSETLYDKLDSNTVKNIVMAAAVLGIIFNLEKIHNISASKKENDCTKYLTYLESFKTVHDGYKNNHCRIFFFMSSNGTDYFPCKDKGVLESRITELQKCKIGDKPDPKTVLPSQAVGKGDLGAAPAKDQKVSGGTTELKAPVAVTSSSSSSTAVTTSPAVSTTKVTTLSTPATTTSTVAAAKPVTITTQAKTTSAATTTNTVTTTSSSSQRSSWFLSGLFSSPRSQTSTSTSNTRASTKPVTTTGTSSVRSSAVT
ncbi:PIR protein, partial [Plasmodium vivax]